MYIYNIAAYMYLIGVSGNKPVNYCVAFSDNLFNRLQEYSQYTRIIDWSGLEGLEYRSMLREFFGEDIFGANTPVYCTIQNNQMRPDYVFDKGLNLVGCKATYFINTNNYLIDDIIAVQTGASMQNLFSGTGYIYGGGNVIYGNPSNLIAGSQFTSVKYQVSASENTVDYNVIIFPEDVIAANGSIDVSKYTELDFKVPELQVHLTSPDDFSTVNKVRVTIQQDDKSYLLTLDTMINGVKLTGAGVTEDDTDNPYGTGGSSGTGGGNGSYINPDETDPAEVPNLPSISACDLGFITMYNPSVSQMKDLSDFMWSNLFDLDTYKKLFSDPMESIIGLAIVPVAPSIGGSKNVYFGTIDSGVQMSYLSSQFVQLDCGSVDIEEWIGSFLDYSPYTKISIYLPYIGIHELSPDDIIGGSIQVVYNIDCLSGACGCFIRHSARGVLYSYNGSCISNIPLTSINFSSAIQNAVSAVCSGAGIIAGIATGAAPITAMSAAGLANSAANAAINSKPAIQRSGSLGGSAGILSIQRPYVIIERPNMSVPASVQKYIGQTSNITMSLGGCNGFTMVEYVHLHGIAATSEEIKEIEAMLKEGVIL